MDEIEPRIRDLIAKYADQPVRTGDEANLFGKLGIDGDDAFDFMDEFEREFGVDMTGYRWYFHHGEEGFGVGGLIFAPPYRRVTPIPLDLDTLLVAAKTKQWPIAYPRHSLPKTRWDLRLNQSLVVVAALGLIALLAWKGFAR